MYELTILKLKLQTSFVKNNEEKQSRLENSTQYVCPLVLKYFYRKNVIRKIKLGCIVKMFLS